MVQAEGRLLQTIAAKEFTDNWQDPNIPNDPRNPYILTQPIMGGLPIERVTDSTGITGAVCLFGAIGTTDENET